MKDYMLIIVSFWCILFYFIGLSYVPSSPTLEYKIKKHFLCFSPQGWGFFTKDPKDVMIDAYELDTSNYFFQLLTIYNTSPNNLFGLSKNNRFVGVELGRILPHIDKHAYKNIIGELSFPEIPDTIYEISTLKEKLKNFKIGKEYIIHQYKHIPYVWAGAGQEKYRPSLIARIKIMPYNEKK